MTDIDPEKLEEAVAECVQWLGVRRDNWPDGLRVVVAFAEDHLATLPRYKEVEVEQFAVVSRAGHVLSVWSEGEDAVCRFNEGETVVRLTGTAKVRA